MKKFLKPFLFICLGLVITTIVFASVRSFDKPTPPRKVLVVKVDATKCTLEYEAPDSQGAGPIISYDIESQGKYSLLWKDRGTSTGLTHQVVGMDEGSEARFRVIASNIYGKSEPSEPTGYVKFVK